MRTTPPQVDAALYDAARRASEQAYAPYSDLRVGAAVLTEGGGIFSGCNVENASFGLTICAERTAIFAAVLAEGPSVIVKRLAIYAEADTVSPCGACRQVLAEFGRDAEVLFPERGGVSTYSLRELLPVPFQLTIGTPGKTRKYA